ncbi:MAG: InlB B-repeat-containing protein [Lachnospiraceae bacterium]|nr:InlB B-repeat-containing protein [Lachnospiraceae bacterium]
MRQCMGRMKRMSSIKKQLWRCLGLIFLIWCGMGIEANAESAQHRYESAFESAYSILDSGGWVTRTGTSGKRHCTLNRQNYYGVNEYFYLDFEVDCGTKVVEGSETYLLEAAIQIDGVWWELFVDYLDGGYYYFEYELYPESLENGNYIIQLSLFKTNNVTDTAVLDEDQCTLTITDSVEHKVTFNYCGGSGKQSSKTVSWGERYSTLPVGTKEGYSFAGWYTKKKGGKEIDEDSRVTTWGNHTLYAHWMKPTLKQTIYVDSSSFTKTYVKNGSFNLDAYAMGTLSYTSSNKNVVTVSSKGKVKMKGYGTAKIKITAAGIWEYKKATRTITVTIAPAKMTLSSVTSPSSKTMVIKWKSDTKASGYQIQVSTSEMFTSGTTTSNSTSNVKNKKATLKNMTKNKTYYVRIRAYKKINGKKVYGAWSTVKSVTIK